MLILAALAFASQAPSDLLAGASTFTLGTAPNDMALVDVNGDGLSDAVAWGRGLTVALRTSGREFATPTVVEPPSYGVAAAAFIGDINGDGVPDIVLPRHTEPNGVIAGNDIRTYFGAGDGSFTLANLQSDPGSWAAVAGDFNGDGRLDIVRRAFLAGSEFELLLGGSGGGFSVAATVPSQPNFISFAAQDVDGDGFLDVLVNGSLGVDFVRGRGDGTFDPAVRTAAEATSYFLGNSSPPRPMNCVDVNGDGLFDLVMSGSQVGTRVHLGDGTGDFGPVIPVSPLVGPTAVGDVNGDAVADLWIAGSTWFEIYHGTGGGSFALERTVATTRGASACIEDLDGDRRPELVVARSRISNAVFSDGNLEVYPGSSRGLVSGRVLPLDAVGLTPKVADLDGDGRSDLVTAYGTQLSVLRGTGAGGFEVLSTTGLGTASQTRPYVLGHFNGDTHLDVVFGDSGVRSYFGDGNGSFVPGQSFSVYGAIASLDKGDIDGDGDPDLVMAESQGGVLRVVKTGGTGSFFTFDALTAAEDVSDLALQDLDGDGTAELLTLGDDGRLSVWPNPGDGQFGAPVVVAVPGVVTSEVRSMTIRDLNGDGIVDVLLSAGVPFASGGLAVVLHGDGAGGFSPTAPTATVAPFTDAKLADLDQDGWIDLVGTAVAGVLTTPGQLVVKGAPGGTFESGGEILAFGSSDAVLVDTDLDGRLDFVGTAGGTLLPDRALVIASGDRVFEPRRGCEGDPSSLGVAASIGWNGTTSVSINDLVLTVAPVPAPAVGFFFVGNEFANVPLGWGTRCVGGSVRRLPVISSGPSEPALSGELSLPFLQALIGQQIEVQCWFRDSASAPVPAGISGSLSLTLAP
jgi:hypothetical protein